MGRFAVTQGGASRRSSLRFALGYAVAAPFGASFVMDCDPQPFRRGSVGFLWMV